MIETAVRLEEELLSRLDKLARERHTNRDTLVAAALTAYLEREHANIARHADLDALAGTWSEQEAKEFEEAIAPFSQVDETIWR